MSKQVPLKVCDCCCGDGILHVQEEELPLLERWLRDGWSPKNG